MFSFTAIFCSCNLGTSQLRLRMLILVTKTKPLNLATGPTVHLT